MTEISLFEVALHRVELPLVGWHVGNDNTSIQYGHILLEESESHLLLENGDQFLME